MCLLSFIRCACQYWDTCSTSGPNMRLIFEINGAVVMQPSHSSAAQKQFWVRQTHQQLPFPLNRPPCMSSQRLFSVVRCDVGCISYTGPMESVAHSKPSPHTSSLFPFFYPSIRKIAASLFVQVQLSASAESPQFGATRHGSSMP